MVTRTERRAELYRLVDCFEWDFARTLTAADRFPHEWREILEAKRERKTKQSFWIDEDVLRFFRSLGPGHGPRMNAVLRTFMLAKLTGLVQGEDLPARFRESWMGRPRPNVTALSVEVEEMGGGSR